MIASHNASGNDDGQRASLRAGGPHEEIGKAVHDLTSLISDIIELAHKSDYHMDLFSFDRETLTDAHKQLGRLIERVPMLQRTAAE